MRTDVDCAEITLRPYAGDGRDRLPNATLRHYRNPRWHRSTILEGLLDSTCRHPRLRKRTSPIFNAYRDSASALTSTDFISLRIKNPSCTFATRR